jgi:hypothetical protein
MGITSTAAKGQTVPAIRPITRRPLITAEERKRKGKIRQDQKNRNKVKTKGN